MKFLLKELIRELHERLSEPGYAYKSSAIKIVKSDFSVEFREISFSKYQIKEEGIASVPEWLLKKFTLNDEDAAVRNVGIKVSKQTRIEDKKSLKSSHKSSLDYC